MISLCQKLIACHYIANIKMGFRESAAKAVAKALERRSEFLRREFNTTSLQPELPPQPTRLLDLLNSPNGPWVLAALAAALCVVSFAIASVIACALQPRRPRTPVVWHNNAIANRNPSTIRSNARLIKYRRDRRSSDTETESTDSSVCLTDASSASSSSAEATLVNSVDVFREQGDDFTDDATSRVPA